MDTSGMPSGDDLAPSPGRRSATDRRAATRGDGVGRWLRVGVILLCAAAWAVVASLVI